MHAYLVDHTGPGTATNHAKHAAAAEDKLEELVSADVVNFAAGENAELVFFLRYAKDVIDRYGRLLAYLTVNVDKDNLAAAPKLSYDERMLEEGMAAPYFIWPNFDPFKKQPTLLGAVPAPEDIAAIAGSGRLKRPVIWSQLPATTETEKASSGRIRCGCSLLSCDSWRASVHPIAW